MTQELKLSGLTQDGKRDEFFYLCAVNRATIVGNLESGLLDKAEAVIYAKAVKAVTEKGEQDPTERTDRVIRLEPKLIEIAGAGITRIHVGRSSQDMHATYRLATLRDDVLEVSRLLNGLIGKITDLADKHVGTIVPNYTNGVAAQPNSWGHYLLGMSEGLVRDRNRLRELYARVNLSPMGSCVLNGTGWPLQRKPMAKRLGFAGVLVNAFDATQVSTVDLPLEYAQILQSVAIHIGSFIQDIMVQYAQPRPWIILQEGGDNTYVSSAMPQKRNPGLMNDTRALASSVSAQVVEVAMLGHNLVPGMQDPKNVSNRAAITANMRNLVAGTERIVAALRINPERALEELNSDWTASQEIADRLMREFNVPFRVGHHAASGMVSYARERGIAPLDFPYEVFREIFAGVTAKEWEPHELEMSEKEFREALDPREIVRARKTEGGPQAQSMAAMLEVRRSDMSAFDGWCRSAQEAIESALLDLEREFALLADN